jgi:hypothetical protein
VLAVAAADGSVSLVRLPESVNILGAAPARFAAGGCQSHRTQQQRMRIVFRGPVVVVAWVLAPSMWCCCDHWNKCVGGVAGGFLARGVAGQP